MRHMLFAASLGGVLCLSTTAATAQSAQSVPESRVVPGRALLDFPLGVLGEAPALATAGGGGLFNPAAILIPPEASFRLAGASLNTSLVRGVEGQTASLVARLRRGTSLGFSFARMSVRGLDRADAADPTVLGTIPYDTYVASVVAATRIGGPLHDRLAIGVAARSRHARADTMTASANAFDVGAVADHLLGKLDARLGASSYLYRPGHVDDDRPAFHAAADARVAGPNDAREGRVGIAYDATRNGTRETFLFASGRLSFAEARVGIANATDFDAQQSRFRFGLGFHTARFTVAVDSENDDRALRPMYQFSLSTLMR